MMESRVKTAELLALEAAVERKTATKTCDLYLKTAYTAYKESEDRDVSTFRDVAEGQD